MLFKNRHYLNEEYNNDVRDTLYANKLLGLLSKFKRKGYVVDSVVPVSENENDYSAEYNIYFSKSGVNFKLNLDIYEGKHTSYSIKNTDTDEVIETGEGRSILSAISTIDFAEIDSLCESTQILKLQGYRVVLNESILIDEAINNPDEPATKRQLWALFCMTKKDYRNENLTKGEASELISKLMAEKNGEKSNVTATTKKRAVSKKPEPEIEGIKVGDIFHYHFGYSMSLNSYVKVKAIKGKKAIVAEVGKKCVEGSLMQGRVVADPNKEDKQTMTALIKNDPYYEGQICLRVPFLGGKYETFRKWDGSPDYEDHMD